MVVILAIVLGGIEGMVVSITKDFTHLIFTSVKLGSHQSKLFHSFLPAWSVAQLVEHLSSRRKTRVQVPAAPILFEQGGLATPCNPATWMLRSRSRRMFELRSD